MINNVSNMAVILTKACNLNCSYCYYNSEYYNSNNETFLSVDRFSDFVRRNNIQSDVIYLTGGEPLLHKDFRQFVDITHSIAKQVFILTNGTLLTRELAKHLQDRNVGINISVDSLNQHYTNRIRGGYDAVFKTLEMLSDMSYGSVKLTPTVTSQNLDMIEEIFCFCDSHNWGIEVSYVELDSPHELALSNSDIGKLRHIITLVAKRKIKNRAEQVAYGIYIEELLKLLINGNRDLHVNTCQSSEDAFVIDTCGNINVCFHDKHVIGTLEDECASIFRSKADYLRNKNYMECMRLGCI